MQSVPASKFIHNREYVTILHRLKIAEAENTEIFEQRIDTKVINTVEFFIFGLKMEAVWSSKTLLYGPKTVRSKQDER